MSELSETALRQAQGERDQGEQAAESVPAQSGPSDMQFAYHSGPPDIVFAGRNWRRGVPQPVTQAELRGMSRRAGWVIFEFRRVDPAGN